MSNDGYSRIDSVKVKAKADYKCQRCGSSETIQAHGPNGDHTDWRKGIALCGDCHADEHPNVPRSLFLSKNHQPYWHNISARTLALEFKRHTRTIIRAAKRLGIASKCNLSEADKSRIKIAVSSPRPKKPKTLGEIRTTIALNRNTVARLVDLRRDGETYEATIKRLLE